MARRKKSGAEGILIVFAIIIGAIVQAHPITHKSPASVSY